MRRARAWVLAALLALVAAAPLARAEPAGGEAAPAAGHADAAPANGTPHERGSHGTGPHTGAPVDSGNGAAHAGGRPVGARPSEGAKDGAANAPAIDARPLPGPRITTRPIKDLLPKPFTLARPHVRHPPAFAIAIPARNAIGIPLGHAPSARPGVTTPVLNPTAKSAGGSPTGGMAALHQIPVPPIPSIPRNTGLNGTAMGRVGTGPATVGGAARFTTGINGTSVRPKHGN